VMMEIMGWILMPRISCHRYTVGYVHVTSCNHYNYGYVVLWYVMYIQCIKTNTDTWDISRHFWAVCIAILYQPTISK
jgi:hypothetical protein